MTQRQLDPSGAPGTVKLGGFGPLAPLQEKDETPNPVCRRRRTYSRRSIGRPALVVSFFGIAAAGTSHDGDVERSGISVHLFA
jgi:hypothetical protein